MTAAISELPETEDVGRQASWELVHDNDTGRGYVVIEATFLGVGASRRIEHDHVGSEVPAGGSCGRCRWMEIRIFRTADQYVVSYTRATEVTGEKDKYRVTSVDSAAELVSTLIRPPRRSAPAEAALRSATKLDEAVAEAIRLRSGG